MKNVEIEIAFPDITLFTSMGMSIITMDTWVYLLYKGNLDYAYNCQYGKKIEI
jgi:hypothetical protein